MISSYQITTLLPFVCVGKYDKLIRNLIPIL